MISVLQQGPSEEPVTVAELRQDLRLDDARDEPLLASLITSARLLIEAQTGVRLITQNWEVLMDDWPGDQIALPHWPVQEIASLSLLGGGRHAVDAALYETALDVRPPRLLLKPGASWPRPRRAALGIAIALVAGFGASATDVPSDLRQAVRALAAHWYEHSSWQASGRGQPVPRAVQSLLQPYRALRL